MPVSAAIARPALPNSPLAEAVFELKWKIPGIDTPGAPPSQEKRDEKYPLLVARFSAEVEAKYPEYEALPHSQLPDWVVSHQPQHRFRVAKEEWPLTQLGPGICSVNATRENYKWEPFLDRCVEIWDLLQKAYPGGVFPAGETIALRYLNAVAFDHSSNPTLDFLKSEFGLEAATSKLGPVLGSRSSSPAEFKLHFAWSIDSPKGLLALKFDHGTKKGEAAIVWDTIVVSTLSDVPRESERFKEWMIAAHELASNTFWGLIAGNLERQFREGT